MCLSLSLLSVWFLVGFSPTEPLIYGNVSLNAVLFTYLPWVEIIVTKWDNWLLCSRIYQSLMPETNSFCRQRTCSSAIEGLSIRAQVWHSVRSKAPRDPGVAACSANTQTVVGTLNAANKQIADTNICLSFSHVCLSVSGCLKASSASVAVTWTWCARSECCTCPTAPATLLQWLYSLTTG